MSDVNGTVLADRATEGAGTFNDDPLPEVNPVMLASQVALLAAEDVAQVGDFVGSTDLGDGITDFRFVAAVPGYEGWQWSVTLFHDEARDTWTVCESSLIPTSDALLPPPWVPWKDRLEPSDLSPTDALGTEENDPRLEDGYRSEATHAMPDDEKVQAEKRDNENAENPEKITDINPPSESETVGTDDLGTDKNTMLIMPVVRDSEEASTADDATEAERIAEEFNLTRRRVLSPLGRSQAAERWYEGPRGPKALSTATAEGKICETCGFYVGLQGDLGRIFGVCANKWSPDDGKVVSCDHGCGEHSQIVPPTPTPMWIQTEPALDDNTIEIVRRGKRDEDAEVEAMETYGIRQRRRRRDPEDANDADINANVVDESGEMDDIDVTKTPEDSDHTHVIQYEESLDVTAENAVSAEEEGETHHSFA